MTTFPEHGLQIEIRPSKDGRAHMRVLWGEKDDWSGWFDSPDAAWAAAKKRVKKELGVDLSTSIEEYDGPGSPKWCTGAPYSEGER